jgi:hypothetical protein
VHSTRSDKVYQLLAHGRWFSPASSTTKAGRHDIAEILLKMALSTKKLKIKSIENKFDSMSRFTGTLYDKRNDLIVLF